MLVRPLLRAQPGYIRTLVASVVLPHLTRVRAPAARLVWSTGSSRWKDSCGVLVPKKLKARPRGRKGRLSGCTGMAMALKLLTSSVLPVIVRTHSHELTPLSVASRAGKGGESPGADGVGSTKGGGIAFRMRYVGTVVVVTIRPQRAVRPRAVLERKSSRPSIRIIF